MIPGVIISYLTFPGIIVHELAHKLFCDVFNVKVVEFSLFDFKGGGYVIHERPEHFHHTFWISTGPLLVNSVMAIVVSAIAASVSTDDTAFLLWVWLAISIGMHAIPSTQDAKCVLHESKLALSEGGSLFHYLSFPFLAVIYVTNLLRFFWIDLIWAAMLIWVGFSLVGNPAALEYIGFESSNSTSQIAERKTDEIASPVTNQSEQRAPYQLASVSASNSITEFSIDLVGALSDLYWAGERFNQANDGVAIYYAFVDGQRDIAKADKQLSPHVLSKDADVRTNAIKLQNEVIKMASAYDRSLQLIDDDGDMDALTGLVEEINAAHFAIAFAVAEDVVDLYTDDDNPVNANTGAINYVINEAQRADIINAALDAFDGKSVDEMDQSSAAVNAILAIVQNILFEDITSYEEGSVMN